ncbi:anthranilate synthase component I family protein [Candidatus Micrarchaeota archaeon]|nr:anthranilate synthase component I family protein [Candidatus Micrarchaeota archaeon]
MKPPNAGTSASHAAISDSGFLGARSGFSSQPLDLLDPLKAFERLYTECEHCFLLESFEQDGTLGRYSYLGFNPETRVLIKDGIIRVGTEEREEDPFSFLKSYTKTSDRKGFRGGLVGYLAHDAIQYVEDFKPKRGTFADMEFGLYLDGVVFDHLQHSARYVTAGKDRMDELKSLLVQTEAPDDGNDEMDAKLFEPFVKQDAFSDSVLKAQERIAAGDAFQVVLSRKFPVRIKGSKMPFYRQLRQTNPSPYQYFLKMGKREIIGSSPEMLVRVENQTATTFPIAGTRPRGRNPAQDAQLEAELRADAKENAEHAMLVDLARNDIGRVCKPGTVKVSAYGQVKKFSHVQHLVSEVSGQLFGTSTDALKSVFPAGTLSGAPKLSALKIIDQLEPQPRGPYGGAVGFLSLDGSCDFAISIRTLFCDGDTAFVQAGAGIVKDSDPKAEFKETEYKAQALLDCLKPQMEEKGKTKNRIGTM